MDILTALKERRSINFFDPDRSVSDETLRELLAVANLGPSAMNLQPWEVIAVRTPERKLALQKCAFNQPKVSEASAMLILVANPAAIEANLDAVVKSMLDLGYATPESEASVRAMPFNLYGPVDGEPRRFFAVKNTALFAMGIMTAARGLGLETHPMDGFVEAQVKEAFGIDKAKIVPFLIAVGYLKPGVKLLPRGWRRPVDDFTSFI